MLKGRVQVEFQVGRKSVCCRPVEFKEERGLYEFFEAVELEYDLPFDDQRDNPEGLCASMHGPVGYDPKIQCACSHVFPWDDPEGLYVVTQAQ